MEATTPTPEPQRRREFKPRTRSAMRREQQRNQGRAESEFRALLMQMTPRLWVTMAFSIAIAVVHVAMLASGVAPVEPTLDHLLQWGADFGPLTLGSEPWRSLTSAFVHINGLHLGLNIVGIWFLGRITERFLGHVGLAMVLLLSAVGGSLASNWWMPSNVSCGASGAAFGVGGAMLACFAVHRRSIPPNVMFPRDADMLAFMFYNPLALGPIAFIALALLQGFRVAVIDNAAHVGGLITGFVAGICLVRPLELDGRRSTARLLVAAGLGVALAFGMFAIRGRVGAEGHVVHADILIERGRYEAALAASDRAIQIHSGYAPAHQDRGLCLGELKQFEAALAAFDRALVLIPNDAWTLGRRGWCLGELGRFDEAVTSLTRSVALNPNDAWSQGNLGWCLGGIERHAEAVAALDRSIALEPNDAWSHTTRCFSLAELGRFEDALAASSRAIELTQGGATVAHLVTRGYVLGNLGRWSEALTVIDRTLERDPENSTAKQNRVWVLENLGREGK